MHGMITSVVRQFNSKDGWTWLLGFRMDDGKSAKLYLVEKFRNFYAWQPYLDGKGWVLTGLVWYNKAKRLLNADSPFYPRRIQTPLPAPQKFQSWEP